MREKVLKLCKKWYIGPSNKPTSILSVKCGNMLIFDDLSEKRTLIDYNLFGGKNKIVANVTWNSWLDPTSPPDREFQFESDSTDPDEDDSISLGRAGSMIPNMRLSLSDDIKTLN